MGETGRRLSWQQTAIAGVIYALLLSAFLLLTLLAAMNISEIPRVG